MHTLIGEGIRTFIVLGRGPFLVRLEVIFF